jgi:hypothetical protein
MAGLHPTALYEIAGLLALHAAVWCAGPLPTLPLVLGGLGALRLLVDPLRAAPPLGAPIVPPAGIATAWLATAVVLGWRRIGPRCGTRQRDTRSAMERVSRDALLIGS